MGDADEPYVIEIEPEVRLWLMNLAVRDYLTVEHAVERLADHATTLGEPYSRHLGSGVRELRFALGSSRGALRIPYWLAPGRRVVLLTVFRKTRRREAAEIARALRAQVLCQAEHGPAHDVFTREPRKEDL